MTGMQNHLFQNNFPCKTSLISNSADEKHYLNFQKILAANNAQHKRLAHGAAVGLYL